MDIWVISIDIYRYQFQLAHKERKRFVFDLNTSTN